VREACACPANKSVVSEQARKIMAYKGRSRDNKHLA